VKYYTIRNCGELGYEFGNITGEGSTVTRDLLRRLLRRIVKRCTSYHDALKEHIFSYSERQFNCVICPSIADITKERGSFVMEHPLTRHPPGEVRSYSGRVDYWLSYRNFASCDGAKA